MGTSLAALKAELKLENESGLRCDNLLVPWLRVPQHRKLSTASRANLLKYLLLISLGTVGTFYQNEFSLVSMKNLLSATLRLAFYLV